jgi:hypothetical protein
MEGFTFTLLPPSALPQLIDPVEGIDGDVASLDNNEAAEKSASGDAKVLTAWLFGAAVLKIPEIVCINVFFPCPPPLVLNGVVTLLLFAPDIDEEEVVE